MRLLQPRRFISRAGAVRVFEEERMEEMHCMNEVRSWSQERLQLALELALWIRMRPVRPRPLLYGLYSESFELFGQKYCWVMEDKGLILSKVTWED